MYSLPCPKPRGGRVSSSVPNGRMLLGKIGLFLFLNAVFFFLFLKAQLWGLGVISGGNFRLGFGSKLLGPSLSKTKIRAGLVGHQVGRGYFSITNWDLALTYVVIAIHIPYLKKKVLQICLLQNWDVNWYQNNSLIMYVSNHVPLYKMKFFLLPKKNIKKLKQPKSKQACNPYSQKRCNILNSQTFILIEPSSH